jgi:hypothetical protein
VMEMKHPQVRCTGLTLQGLGTVIHSVWAWSRGQLFPGAPVKRNCRQLLPNKDVSLHLVPIDYPPKCLSLLGIPQGQAGEKESFLFLCI